MSNFIVTEHVVGGGGAVQAYYHNGTILAALGVLPAAALEANASVGGAALTSLYAHNRGWVMLDSIFVLQNGIIYKSTDEGVTFAAVHTLAATAANDHANFTGPVAVMVQGALKYIGFYVRGANIGVYEYTVATDSWADADLGIAAGLVGEGVSIPCEHKGLIYGRVGGAELFSYDPVSAGVTTLTFAGLSGTNTVQAQCISWDDTLWLGPLDIGGVTVMGQLVGTAFTAVPIEGIGLIASTHLPAIFIDPLTGNLIILWEDVAGAVGLCYELTSAGLATNRTGTVIGVALALLFTGGSNTRLWPHYERTAGGGYTVHIYGTRGRLASDPIERFTWVDVASPMLETGVVAGHAAMAFPYAVQGGGDHLFFPGERRVLQTAEAGAAFGLTVTAEAYQQAGGTISVRGHQHKVSDPGGPPLSPMTIQNPSLGLGLGGINPGAQINGVPTNRTPFSFDWRQDADGFVSGDNYVHQLEGF